MKNLRWKTVGRTTLCPICGKDSWCAVGTDGRVANCRRECRGAFKSKKDKNGVDYYVHKIGDSGDTRTREPSPPPTIRNPILAGIDDLHRVYSRLLSRLTLSDVHRDSLRERGLSDGEIATREYRTLLPYGRGALAHNLAEEFGEDLCSAVPGLHARKSHLGKVWDLLGPKGSALLIPSRNHHGKIEALKVRPDDALPGRKYLYLSSSAVGGPSPGARVHIPLMAHKKGCLVRLTEGELKADVATTLSGILTISIPGVQCWRLGLPALRTLEATTVRLAFDADAREKQDVGLALRETALALRQQGFEIEVETWKK